MIDAELDARLAELLLVHRFGIRLQACAGLCMLREGALEKVMVGETSLAVVLEHTVAVDTPVAVPA